KQHTADNRLSRYCQWLNLAIYNTSINSTSADAERLGRERNGWWISGDETARRATRGRGLGGAVGNECRPAAGGVGDAVPEAIGAPRVALDGEWGCDPRPRAPTMGKTEASGLSLALQPREPVLIARPPGPEPVQRRQGPVEFAAQVRLGLRHTGDDRLVGERG